jgi:hypothetical protein
MCQGAEFTEFLADGGKLVLTHNAKPEAFKFDRCFAQGSSQEEVFMCMMM